jgi:predicted porin
MDKDKALKTLDVFLEEIVVLLLEKVEKCLGAFDYTSAHCHLITAEYAFNRAASLYVQYAPKWTSEHKTRSRVKLELIAGHLQGARDVIQAGE